jgi:hypothetical protein
MLSDWLGYRLQRIQCGEDALLVRDSKEVDDPQRGRKLATLLSLAVGGAVRRSTGVLKQVIRTELVQVEVARILHYCKWDLNLVQRSGWPRRNAVPRTRLPVQHPARKHLPHRLRRSLTLKALHNPQHSLAAPALAAEHAT